MRPFVIAACVAIVWGAIAPLGIALQENQTAAETDSSANEVLAWQEVTQDELRIRLAPLSLEELQAIRDSLMEVARGKARELVDLLVQAIHLQKSAEPDDAAKKELQGSLDAQLEARTMLLSRANIILNALEARGGDVAADRAYLASFEDLQPPEAPASESEVKLSAEDQAAQAVRQRTTELVAVVRAEPPINERPDPWTIPVTELELEMQPLTLEQIEQRLDKWEELLQREVRKRIRYDILLNNPEKLEQTQAARDMVLRNKPSTKVDLGAVKTELATRSQQQQQVIEAIVERMEIGIKLIRMRGGDPSKYVDYISSSTGQKLNLFDPVVLSAQIRNWLVSPTGGIKIGLNIIKFIAVVIAFWILSVILGWIARMAIGRLPKASVLLRPLFVTTVRRLTMIIGLIIAVTMLGVNAGPLLAMIGAAGLVVGLALQGTLSNFASGILILLNRPFDVGDVINAGGVLGKVESMNLVSTSILTFDNQVMLVPNNQIWNGVITNITGRDTRRVDLVFGIGYGDDIAKAIQIIEETLTGHEKVLPHPEPVVRVNELGDNSVNLIARPWTRTSDYWDVYWDLMRDVKLRFDEAGINIPFPQRDLHVPGPIEVRFADGGAPSMPSPAGTSSASMNPTKPTHEPGPAESADDSANGD
jgi:small conductance mechanosensitive channel